MGMLITDSKPFTSGGQVKKLVEVRCDDIEELTPADPEWAVGSIAWDVTTGKFYGLNSEGEWKEQE